MVLILEKNFKISSKGIFFFFEGNNLLCDLKVKALLSFINENKWLVLNQILSEM